MNVISGQNVDLIYPFPLGEVQRTYGWNHCYRTLTESDDSPTTPEGFIPYVENVVQTRPTWGIIDKNHITNIKHEAPLVGILIFEPILSGEFVRNGFLHVATARKAWRTGLVDEAGQLVIKTLFDEIPPLLRVSGTVVEKNFPAKAWFKRMGFKFEGIVEDAILKNGAVESMVLFGLTRRGYRLWESLQQETHLAGQSEECLGISGEVEKSQPQPQELQTCLETPQCLEVPTKPLEEQPVKPNRELVTQ